MPQAWPVEPLHATPARIHERDLDVSRRRLVLCSATTPALVLGSTQPESGFDPEVLAARRIATVRRRSGGGAVLVRPGGILWAEVVLPSTDPLWEADLGRSFLWLGRVWAAALRACGVGRVRVHHGPMRRTRWSPTICFAGLGPGEVTVAGRKVLGLAQRRRRDGAVFQCAALLTWEPEETGGLVAGPEDDKRDLVRQLGELAAPVGVAEADLTAALTRALAAFT